MDKAFDFLDNFFYEFSSYLFTGFLIIKIPLSFYLDENVSINNFTFKDYFTFDNFDKWYMWIFLLLLSYLIGMLFAGMVFRLFRFISDKFKFPRYTTSHGIFRELKNPTNKTFAINDQVKTAIKNRFKVDCDEELKEKYILISSLLENYLKEKSNSKRPDGRYYERICLSRNIAVFLFLFSFTQIIIFQDEEVSTRIFVLVFCLLSIIPLLEYAFLQAKWRAEVLIRRFYVIESL